MGLPGLLWLVGKYEVGFQLALLDDTDADEFAHLVQYTYFCSLRRLRGLDREEPAGHVERRQLED